MITHKNLNRIVAPIINLTWGPGTEDLWEASLVDVVDRDEVLMPGVYYLLNLSKRTYPNGLSEDLNDLKVKAIIESAIKEFSRLCVDYKAETTKLQNIINLSDFRTHSNSGISYSMKLNRKIFAELRNKCKTVDQKRAFNILVKSFAKSSSNFSNDLKFVIESILNADTKAVGNVLGSLVEGGYTKDYVKRVLGKIDAIIDIDRLVSENNLDVNSYSEYGDFKEALIKGLFRSDYKYQSMVKMFLGIDSSNESMFLELASTKILDQFEGIISYGTNFEGTLGFRVRREYYRSSEFKEAINTINNTLKMTKAYSYDDEVIMVKGK